MATLKNSRNHTFAFALHVSCCKLSEILSSFACFAEDTAENIAARNIKKIAYQVSIGDLRVLYFAHIDYKESLQPGCL